MLATTMKFPNKRPRVTGYSESKQTSARYLDTDWGKSGYYRPFIGLAIPRLNIARMIGQALPAALLAASGASQAFVALAPSSNNIRATLIARRSG